MSRKTLFAHDVLPALMDFAVNKRGRLMMMMIMMIFIYVRRLG